MLQTIYYILFSIVLIYGLYFIITGLFAFLIKQRKIGHYDPKHKLAVLVAARNEEEVIGDLIKSLKNQTYPEEYFDIIVIPNNCTDQTEKRAKKAGAIILPCTQPVKSKGDVLRFAFEKLSKSKKYDAYLVFDADNLVHPNFLARMNDTLCEGYEVAQGFRDSKNPEDGWISGSYSLFYWGQNIFFNKSRMNLNLSASINGTGFMIKDSIIKKNGFNTVTLTEDIEFTAQCAINDVQIAFVEDAVTYDEQPLTFGTSWKQRKRWSTGTYQCLVTYYKPLAKKAIFSMSSQALDMLFHFISPVIQLLGFFVFLLLMVYNVIGIQLHDIFSYMFAYNVLFFFLAYIASLLLGVFVVKFHKKRVSETIFGIVTFPLFLFSWIGINIVCLVKKNMTWEPIKHYRTINIGKLIKEDKK